MCNLLMFFFFFAFLATPRQGSSVPDPRRQLGPEGFDTPDGPRPIARQESSASIAVGSRCRNDTDFDCFSILWVPEVGNTVDITDPLGIYPG